MENKDSISYEAAFEELQSIIQEMENGNISVDVLAEKVKRATALIKTCKQKLTTTQEDVSAIMKELEEN